MANKIPRVPVREQDPAVRATNFEEVCLGYNLFFFEAILPNTPAGKNAQVLDIMDYVANYILMPVVSIS